MFRMLGWLGNLVAGAGAGELLPQLCALPVCKELVLAAVRPISCSFICMQLSHANLCSAVTAMTDTEAAAADAPNGCLTTLPYAMPPSYKNNAYISVTLKRPLLGQHVSWKVQ